MTHNTTTEAENEQIAGHYCGQTQAHAAHVWQTPPVYGAMTFASTYQCAGVTAEVPPGPCWHNSGMTWPGQNFPVRCELLAGHDGAHQAAGRAGGEAVWEHSAGDHRTRPGMPSTPALSCSALWSRNQGVSCCVTSPHTVHRGSSEPDAPSWGDGECVPGTLTAGRGGR